MTTTPTSQRAPIQILRADFSDAMSAYRKAASPRERGLVYVREFREPIEKGDDLAAMGKVLERYPIAAADTFIEDMVAQRTLDLIVGRRPFLKGVTADFSDVPAKLGATITTRVMPIPDVENFNAGAVMPEATDYPVTLSNHKEVHYQWPASIYVSTPRALIDENSEAMAAAIGGYLVDSVWALVTDAFASETAGAAASNDFSALTTAAKALNTAGARDWGRSMWVNSDFAEALSNDELTVPFVDAQNPTAYAHWRNIRGFSDVWEFPSAAANEINLIGFAFQKAALIVVTRVADNPLTNAHAHYPGSLRVITDPVSGFSVLADKWVTQSTRAINCRLDVMFGCARGVLTAGHKFVTS